MKTNGQEVLLQPDMGATHDVLDERQVREYENQHKC